jgi:hypothetical protein
MDQFRSFAIGICIPPGATASAPQRPATQQTFANPTAAQLNTSAGTPDTSGNDTRILLNCPFSCFA